MVQHADIDHTGLTGVGSGSGNPLVYDIEHESAGDITVNDTAAGSFSDVNATVGDVVVAAVTGDLLMIGLSTGSGSSGNSMRIDVASIVSAAAVNFLSSRTGTPATLGVTAWFCHGSAAINISGEVPYIVQAGDLSGGNVTLRLCAWVSGSTRALQASSNSPLIFWVRNLGTP